MSNIASALKEEIVRLARKEVRTETAALKKASAQHRSDIAALKRRVTALEQQVSRITKTVAKVTAETGRTADANAGSRMRFTAKGLRTLRQRLGLSGADLGKLLGVTAQTVYNWEAETTKPRGEQVGAILALRRIGKTEAAARIEKLAA